MKREELRKVWATEDKPEPEFDEYYNADDVDLLLDEKDAEIASLKAVNESLKAKLESVQASAYADSVDAGMRERRLRRALYKACANWALSTLAWLDCIDQGEPGNWAEMQRKCLKMSEEYK